MKSILNLVASELLGIIVLLAPLITIAALQPHFFSSMVIVICSIALGLYIAYKQYSAARQITKNLIFPIRGTSTSI